MIPIIPTESDIKEYQALYLKHFGKEIGWDEASQEAQALLQIVQLLSRPVPPHKCQNTEYIDNNEQPIKNLDRDVYN